MRDRTAAGDVIAAARATHSRRHTTGLSDHAALVYLGRLRAAEQLQTWIETNLRRGYRVIHKHAGPAPTRGHLYTDPAQVEHVRAMDVHRATGGRPAALLEWHQALLDQALDAGHTGLAVTCDGPALRTITPDPAAMLAHERDLTALSDRAPFGVLCRYDLEGERPAELTALIAAHSPMLDDVTFSAARHDGCLHVAGELDAANADRLAAVLHTALAEGVREVDLAEVTVLSAATVRVLVEAGDVMGAGEALALSRPTAAIRHVIELVRLTASGSVTVLDRSGPG